MRAGVAQYIEYIMGCASVQSGFPSWRGQEFLLQPLCPDRLCVLSDVYLGSLHGDKAAEA